MEKKWYQSKTLWFNVAFGVLAVGTAALNHFGYADFQPGNDIVTLVSAIVAIVNVVLRFVTDKKLTV
jgi:hypothetical protein